MKKRLSIGAFLFFLLIGFSGNIEAEKVNLSVLLYPWVPDFNHISKVIESEFEKQHPGINLVISEQNWNYYEFGGLDKRYDVYELDMIFLADFINKGRIQPLDLSKLKKFNNAFSFAQKGSMWNGKHYGVPHWICSLFIFYFSHDEEMKKVRNLETLINAIEFNHQRGRGLLIDMNGHSTLAEFYLHTLLNLSFTPSEAISILKSGKLNERAVKNLSLVVKLVDPGNGRGIITHKAWPPWHPHEFAHARGRALVGYSERMYHILQEIKKPTDNTPVVNPLSINVQIYNESEMPPNPLIWIDSFTIDESVVGVKEQAAYAFLNYMMRDDIYVKCLLPNDSPPLYLMPAFTTTYRVPQLLKAGPLYNSFLNLIKNGITITSEGIHEMFEKAGAQLDAELSKNLYPND